MRLLRLDLLAWGLFDGLSLDLSARKLHLVYGPNEAGKSTTRRAVHALLFGVPRGATDAHALGKATMLRVGGLVADEHGAELDFVRKGGVKDTLVSPAGASISEDALVRLRGSVGADTFSNVFSMDHTSLKEGAEAVLESGGELSESLAVAALGSAKLAEAKSELEERETRLYNPAPQAKTSELHAAIRALKEAKTRLESSESSPEAFATQEAALDEARRSHVALVVRMAELRLRRERLEEAAVARPVVEGRARVLARLATLAEVPRLPSGLELELTRISSERKSATSRLRVLEEEKRELEDRARVRKTYALPAACVARLPDIERGLRAWEARELRRRDLARQRSTTMRAAERLAAVLGPAGASAAARLLLGKRATWQRLAEDAKERRTRLDETQRRVVELENGLGALPPSRAASIDLALAPLDALFGLDETASSALRAVAEARRDEASSSAKVTTSSLASFEREPSLEGLVGCSLPSRERLAEVVEAIEFNREKLERTNTEEADVRARRAAIRERLAVEAGTTRAVTEDDLSKAREARDVRVTALAKDGSTVASVREAITLADTLADRMRREVDRVLRHVELIQEESTLAEKEDALRQTRETLTTALSEAGVGELACARALGGRVHDVAGLPAFRAKMDLLVEALRARDEARLVLGRASETADGLASAYAKALGRTDQAASLAELRAIVIDRREKLRAESALERARDEGRLKLEADLRATIERQRREESALELAQGELREALPALGLSESATSEVVRERFDVLAEIVRTDDIIAEIDAELESMGKEDAKLEADIDATFDLVEKRLPLLEWQPAPASRIGARAEDLVHRLERAKRAEAETSLDADTLEKLVRETKVQTRTVKEATARRDELFAKTAARDDISFLEVVRRAEDRDLLERKLQSLDEEIGRLARKSRVSELEELVAKRTVEETEVEMATLDTDLARLELEAKRALEAAGRNEQGIEQFRSHDLGAALAAEDVELALAHVVRKTEEWLAARAARRLLERRIEAYRAENQGPVIERASLHFRTLTLGVYEGIAVEVGARGRAGSRARRAQGGDRGERVERVEATSQDSELSLHAVRARDQGARSGHPLSVAELSTGTRDQLYFALRLASLERLESLGTKAPIVIDDALVHFDDDRARAAFSALAGLASTATVLFFTHHTRMRELAVEALGDQVVVHTLTK